MFSGVRRRMTYANVAATVAVVFAMSGGAYAASKYLITSTKQIKPSVLASLKGKAGANGAAGAQGPAGPQGPAGAGGAKGEPGPQGSQGKEGPAGKDGTNGTTGFTETLPSGKTLKGEWDVSGYVAEELNFVQNSVSFGIPLEEEPVTHYIKAKEATPAGCTGNVEEPGAEKGNLCIFASREHDIFESTEPELPVVCPLEQTEPCFESHKKGASRIGFGIEAVSKEAGLVVAQGTWAVTAE
jgi:hypothetical protein